MTFRTCVHVTKLFYFDSYFIKVFSMGPIDSKLALVQVMAWYLCLKPEPMTTQFTEAYMGHMTNDNPVYWGICGSHDQWQPSLRRHMWVTWPMTIQFTEAYMGHMTNDKPVYWGIYGSHDQWQPSLLRHIWVIWPMTTQFTEAYMGHMTSDKWLLFSSSLPDNDRNHADKMTSRAYSWINIYI